MRRDLLGTPLPPRSPAAISCHWSARYTVEHGGQAVCRRLPQACMSTPSGSTSVEYDPTCSPVATFTATTRPDRRIGRCGRLQPELVWSDLS